VDIKITHKTPPVKRGFLFYTVFINMRFIITESQSEKLHSLIQEFINTILNLLDKESEEWGLGEMDELHELESIKEIKVTKVISDNGIKAYIDIYLSYERFELDNIKNEIEYRLGDYIPNVELILENVYDENGELMSDFDL